MGRIELKVRHKNSTFSRTLRISWDREVSNCRHNSKHYGWLGVSQSLSESDIQNELWRRHQCIHRFQVVQFCLISYLFRNTVYTFHVPLSDSCDMKQLVPDDQQIRNALEVLFELMFRAKLQSDITDNERKAVLSELQIMNTVEYRSEFSKFQQVICDRIPLTT